MIEVAGQTCELFTPEQPASGQTVVFLHDLAGRSLREEPALCEAVAAAGLPVIAPRTGRSWWLDAIQPAFDPQRSAERFVVEAVRTEAIERFGARPTGIALLGIGMGGQGALRIAYRHPAIFPIAAAIGPAIDFHLGMRHADRRDDGELFDTLWELYGDVERARQETAILHVHPLNWPRQQWFASDPADVDWHDGCVRLHSKLAALGIPHEWNLEPQGDAAHETLATRVAAEAVRFLVSALDKESRRLA
jgi:S-formylglutathione hydrolase